MPRTYGGYAYAEQWDTRPGPVFVTAAAPAVLDKFKRTFPGHKQNGRSGEIAISATDANARDLLHFIGRYPLLPLDAESEAQLRKKAEAHVNAEEVLLRVLSGEVPDLAGSNELAITPRDYQLIPPAMVRASGFLLLEDDLGLGKTVSAGLLFTDPEALPALIVCPVHLVDHWANEQLPKMFPWIRTHVLRSGQPYEVARHRSCKGKEPHVYVASYSKLYGWADQFAGKIRTVIFDEVDELHTGGDTRKYIAAQRVAHRARYRMGLTGTAVHNWADEMWNILDLLSEGILGTPDEFRQTWGGKRVSNPRGFGQHLRNEGFTLRRTKADVGRELPPLSQMIYPIETDHDLLKREMTGIIAMAMKVLDTTGDRIERFSMSGQLEHKVRQATGVAKAPYVAAYVRLLLQDPDRKIILVGHHHEVYDIWKRELAEFNPVFYTGRESTTQKTASKKQFVDGDARVFVLAVRSGSGLDGLQHVSSTVLFGEVDWVPARHDQAIGRAFRDGQLNPVDVFFLMSDGGSDPKMADTIELKRRVSEPIRDPDAEIVQTSPEEAFSRVQELAKDLLRRHGVALPKQGQPLPQPVSATGELLTRDDATGKILPKPRSGDPTPRDEAGRIPAGAVPHHESQQGKAEIAVLVAAENTERHRVAEGHVVEPDCAAVPASRKTLHARLTGAMR